MKNLASRLLSPDLEHFLFAAVDETLFQNSNIKVKSLKN